MAASPQGALQPASERDHNDVAITVPEGGLATPSRCWTERDAELSVADLEAEARRRGLLLRLQVRRPAGLLWTLRVGVAQPAPLALLGELKGWALPSAAGLRLDTMRVQGEYTVAVGALIWAATFAWALEATPCRHARLLAIRDHERQHRRLVRYFRRLGFTPLRELGGGVADLAPRLLWGGAGLLMEGDCVEGLRRSAQRLAQVQPSTDTR